MTRAVSPFADWSALQRRLRRAKRVALFLDFDGTLAPLRRRPAEAQAPAPVRLLLRRLSKHPRVVLTLVSGRRRADLRQRLRIPGAHYLGLHGSEGADPPAVSPAQRRVLRWAAGLLAEQLPRNGAVWIEDKAFALSVHYRGAPAAAAARARQVLHRALEPFAADLRILPGHKVWEVLPRALGDKGAAARARLAQLPQPALPVYVGDDASDEPAFAELRSGITVRVGPARRTGARYRLRDPQEVGCFLEALYDALS